MLEYVNKVAKVDTPLRSVKAYEGLEVEGFNIGPRLGLGPRAIWIPSPGARLKRAAIVVP